jgi:hypothetical protein
MGGIFGILGFPRNNVKMTGSSQRLASSPNVPVIIPQSAFVLIRAIVLLQLRLTVRGAMASPCCARQPGPDRT